MGRHARPRIQDPATIALTVIPGGISLYPKPGESPEDKARWLDRSWGLCRELALDDRLFGLGPYCHEIGSKAAIDPYTGDRRGRDPRA